jgi:hypothetical protein
MLFNKHYPYAKVKKIYTETGGLKCRNHLFSAFIMASALDCTFSFLYIFFI